MTGYDAVCGVACDDFAHKSRRLRREGRPLLRKEALDVLALRPRATPTEIKEAYRDLVKVWHPDRFGSDPRLRQKAEDKLKQLNDAYGVLQSKPVVDEGDMAEAADSSRGDASSVRYSSARVSRKGRVRWSAVGAGWIYGFLGIALGCAAGALLLERGLVQTARSRSASAQQAASASQQVAAGTSASQAPGQVLAGASAHSEGRPRGNVESKVDGRSNGASSAQFRVFSLSDAQTSQLDSACSSQKEEHGPAAYQACVKAQLDLITNAASTPDLTALNAAERESIESVCSEARRHRGADAYNRCLNAQMAWLAAEPLRPDLSALREADRSSVESACRNAKYREGPSAYDRCLVRFTKLLGESK